MFNPLSYIKMKPLDREQLQKCIRKGNLIYVYKSIFAYHNLQLLEYWRKKAELISEDWSCFIFEEAKK